ncbi:hypothetical protein GCM10011512_17480 [Tersicoccus solisilvae]|uniref:Integral membrane protein n=1 Tax=Tersicoccus solisilvae TaxID=1882339 RepID=A0ABQ1P5E2_9MICC|nr:hypothetical protein [Tersicoccus solisilvae]GGC90945.1 hypothetical protein GCM10011512_17480 [Tersicoccus solisilvae]
MDLPRTLVTVAAAAYAANCALGASVAARWIDTSNVRWVHHGLYIVTSVTTAVAAVVAGAARSPAAIALAPAVVPLVLLQRHGARPLPRHRRDALAAAPCYAAGLALAWR